MNRKNCIPFLTFISFFLNLGILSAQEYSIEGKILNKEKQSVEFATVFLIKDDLIVTQSYTDSLGAFYLKASTANYRLIIEQFGQEFLNKNIVLNENIDLGAIEIDESVFLSEISITAQKKLIERKVDRLVFNVASSTKSSGSDALELLKITPRVKVQNDQVSMIGKRNMMVMIDDRLVQLSGSDLTNYLLALSSDDIQSIEIITNPPAKYSAEGNSGIINIVTKKAKEEMWSSSIQTVYIQRSYPGAAVRGSFNYKKDKVALTLNANYFNGSSAPIDNNTIEYPDIIWNESNKRHDSSTFYALNLGLDYQLSNKISTGFNYRYSPNDIKLRSNLTSSLMNVDTQVVDSLIKTPSIQIDETKLHTLNYHFIYDIDTLKRKLSFDFDYFNYNSASNSNFNSNTYQPSNLNNPISFFAGSNIGSQKTENLSFNLDMDHPTNWVKLNYGFRFSSIKTDSGFEYYDLTGGIPIFDTNQSNQFLYKENTQASYISAHKEWSNKWESQIGLRLENTQTEGNSLTLKETHKENYIKLFPTAYISYVPNDNNSFSLSYSRRINRPSYRMLNPFRWVGSAYSYVEGNPYLQPAFSDNLEFEYIFKDNFISSVYFSHTDDDFEQLTIVDQETNIKQVVPQNFIVNKTIGFNQNIIFKPFHWWNANFFGTVYYSSTDSKTPVTLQYLKGWNGEFSIDNDFALNSSKTLFFNIRYNFVTKGVSSLDYNSAFDQLNASFKGLFFDKKLTVSLQANDILNSNITTYTGYSNGLKNYFKNHYDSRYVLLSVAYSFGKKFNTDSHENRNSAEQNRIN